MKNEILIYDVVGQDYFGAGVIAKEIKAQLDGFGEVDEITVRINSPGGDVFEGLAIYNLLDQHPAKITVKVDGYAASIASIIAMAGDDIQMAENAMLMIHNPYTFAFGDAEQMRSQADVLDKVKDSLIITYQARASVEYGELSDMMDAETWLDADESIAQGFATTKVETKASLTNVDAFKWINHAPAVATPAKTPAPTEGALAALSRSIEIDRARAEMQAQRIALKAG